MSDLTGCNNITMPTQVVTIGTGIATKSDGFSYVDATEHARKAVVYTYRADGCYNEKFLDEVLEGKHDETFVIRAIKHALEKGEL